jgi:protein-L-isoaspartate(D-aspartate) O-methyltransferase
MRLKTGTSALQRENMVESQIRPSDVTDRRITTAMREIPRERFVPASLAALAYMDDALPVAPGRSLMAPRVLARLLQLAEIEANQKVLIVGASFGYAAAVTSSLAGEIVALDTDETILKAAAAAFKDHGIGNVTCVCGPLTSGWPALAPYDVILIDGAVERVPPELLEQMTATGRLVTVEIASGVGRATVFQNSGSSGNGHVSRRIAFDASAQLLPGFEHSKSFAF